MFVDCCQIHKKHLTHLTSPHLTSPHLTSPHLTSPHLTPPHLTSPHLTSPVHQGTCSNHSKLPSVSFECIAVPQGCHCVSAGKSFEDDDVELICSKSGLGPLQTLTDALAATQSAQEQQSLLQVGCILPFFVHAVTPTQPMCMLVFQRRYICCMPYSAQCPYILAGNCNFLVLALASVCVVRGPYTLQRPSKLLQACMQEVTATLGCSD